MARVGILSDTHGRLSLQACACLAECDYLIHAGDIGDPGILRELSRYAPVVAVLGNNDYTQDYGGRIKRFAQLSIEGVQFYVGHFPRDVRPGFSTRATAGGGAAMSAVPAWEGGAVTGDAVHTVSEGGAATPASRVPLASRSEGVVMGEGAAAVYVHGHVHYPVLLWGEEAGPASLLVCPGSVSFPRMGSVASVAFVDVSAACVLDAWVESLDGIRLM